MPRKKKKKEREKRASSTTTTQHAQLHRTYTSIINDWKNHDGGKKEERRERKSARREGREAGRQGFESSRGSALATQRRVKWIGDDTSAATTQSSAEQSRARPFFPFWWLPQCSLPAPYPLLHLLQLCVCACASISLLTIQYTRRAEAKLR